jgi:hypothetical protein
MRSLHYLMDPRLKTFVMVSQAVAIQWAVACFNDCVPKEVAPSQGDTLQADGGEQADDGEVSANFA